jgi:hypothetical protein
VDPLDERNGHARLACMKQFMDFLRASRGRVSEASGDAGLFLFSHGFCNRADCDEKDPRLTDRGEEIVGQEREDLCVAAIGHVRCLILVMKSPEAAAQCVNRLVDAGHSAATWDAIATGPMLGSDADEQVRAVIDLVERRIHPVFWSSGREGSVGLGGERYQANSRDKRVQWQFRPQVPWDKSLVLWEAPNAPGGIWTYPSL